jgi:hypothetical protein
MGKKSTGTARILMNDDHKAQRHAKWTLHSLRVAS